ncbi:hypothetical protein EDB85DRAFT_2228842 [Lactarius pseudohatsudake]|nr:hypothetical protein EDB85DRAFT_2228842 [Lactarius pseudohatsudake]
MEQNNTNRYALLETDSPPPTNITITNDPAMEAATVEQTPPTGPPLPTIPPSEGLNNSTLVPTTTPEDMERVIMVHSSSPISSFTPTPQLVTVGAQVLDELRLGDESLFCITNPADFADDPELAALLQELEPSPSAPAPSPDTIVARQARAYRGIWLREVGRIAPQTIEALQAEYTVNIVGDPNVWELSCWMHRAHVSRLEAFLTTHTLSDLLLASIEHAFANRLTRLHDRVYDHSVNAQDYALGLLLLPIFSPVYAALLRLASPTKRLQSRGESRAGEGETVTQEAREYIAAWRARGGIPPPKALPPPEPTFPTLPSPGPDTQEAMRQAVPSPIIPIPSGSAQNPIMLSSKESSPSLITPRMAQSIERAKRRTTWSQSITRPPRSRRPSISLHDMASAAFDANADEPDGGSESSTTPTAPTPWPHAIPKEDWPSEWGSHTPSEHSSVAFTDGMHPRHPIQVDTPTPEVASASRSPPTDMGRPDPKGKMTSAGAAPRALSPMEVVWGPSTQTQEARATLDELRLLSTANPPSQVEITDVYNAQIEEAAEWANIWADSIAPLREGYARYVLDGPIPPLKGGNRIEPPHVLDTAFRVVVAAVGGGFDKPGSPEDRTLASGNWFRAVSALMGATIRGMLVSQGFFDQGSWPLDPCIDKFSLADDLERPSTQLELVRSMTEQLLAELMVQGEDRLNREDLWNSIKEQEIAMLRDAMSKQASTEIGEWEREMIASLKGKAIDRALAGLIEDLEAEGSSCASGAELAKEVLDKVMDKKGKQGVKPIPPKQIAKWQNEYVQEARKELKAKAYAKAEREWKLWKENQLAKAQGEAMRRLSINYVIEACGDDAALIIAEKRDFAKEYAHSNYQNWVNQALEERWPSIESDAQKWTREEYMTRELNAIYPEVHAEAYAQAKADAKALSESYRDRLVAQRMATIDRDEQEEIRRQNLTVSSKRGKKARKITIDARRTDLHKIIDSIDTESDPNPAQPIATTEQLITTEALHQLVQEDANFGDSQPNSAYKLGVAMGMVQPIAGLEPQVRPHLGFAPSPETIGEPSPTPSPTHRPTMVEPLQINEEVARQRTTATSTHAVQEVEPSPPPPEKPYWLADLMAALAPLTAKVDSLTAHVNEIDQRTRPQATTSLLPPLESIEEDFPMLASPSPDPIGTTSPPAEGGSSTSGAPQAGRPKGVTFAPQSPAPSPPGPPPQETSSGVSTAEASPSPLSKGARTDTGSAAPSPPVVPSPPAPKPKGKGKAKGARTTPVAPSPPSAGASTAKDNNGFITVTRPKLAYNIVSATAVKQQQTSKAQTANFAAAQQRSASGRLQPGASPTPQNTTRVVVARHGGFPDPAKEATLRATLPEIIATSVRACIERGTPAPIKILSGRWAKGVEKTGNYVYTITGKITMERILQYSKFLLQPFPGGTLLPAKGWHWAQLREVLVHGEDGVHTEEQLLAELVRNPAFDGVPFVAPPHWERDIMKMDTATATVIFAYVDPTGKVNKEAMSNGVFMFNFGVKYVYSGDSPRPKQCGRCFVIGHSTNAPECRWNGKIRNCPARGDFPPPRPTKKIVDDGAATEAPTPAPPKSILKRPTELPTPSPPTFTPARVDDEETPLFDPSTLASETPAITPPPVTTPPPPPAPSRPKARIVLPGNDTAKPDETSTERAATRNQLTASSANSSTPSLDPAPLATPQAAGPGPVDEFPPLPAAIPNPIYDHPTRVHIEDRAHCLLTEAVTGFALVQVGEFWYRCPLNEMNIPFRRLRDREMLILNKMRYGDVLGPEDKLNFTAKYEREARKSRAFGNFDLHASRSLMKSFSIASVNMGRRNAAMATLLETNYKDDLLCVSEPWFGRIGTTRHDQATWGKEALGGANNSKWHLLYPYYTNEKRAKVMMYARKHDLAHPGRPNGLEIVTRNDLGAHPCLLIADIKAGSERWRVVLFYNDVEDPSAMTTLRNLTSLWDGTPTLVVGDFNLHSRTWSPPGWLPSTRVDLFETWMAEQTLHVAIGLIDQATPYKNDTVAPTTGDRWGWNQVQSYTIPRRGERNVPTRYLKAARWRTHRGETGYFVDFPNRPSRYYPVEFSFEHTCWCILATNDEGVRTVVRPTTHEYRCDILESEVVPLARVGPIDGAIVTSTTEEGDSESDQNSEESEEDHLSQVNAEEQEELTNLANRAAGITLDEAPQAEHIVVHPPDEMTTTQLEPTYTLQTDPIQQPHDGVPEDLLPIHPDTGHRMTADDAALMRAIGPDEPDPPEGGGPPGEAQEGATHKEEEVGVTEAEEDRLEEADSRGLQGNTPMVFNGDRTKALQFRAQWNLYQGVNSTSDIMRNYYRRSLLFLGYIQGDQVNEWVMYMTDWLMRQTEAGFPEHTRRLWEETLRAFTRRFSNTMEKEQAQAELRKGVHMKDGDIDSYVATFERLARQADYNLDAPQTIDLFTAGLPKGLFTKVYEQYEPTTFEAWKQAAMKKQQQYLHLQARLNSIKPSVPKTTSRPSTWGPPQSGWAPRNLPHQQNPNAMDTSADRTRARGVETEGTQGRLAGAEFILGNQQRPPYPPRGGPRTRGRGRGLPRDAREVICYTCNQKGHFSRYCPQNRDTVSGSSNRRSETDYYAQEPRVEARAAMTPEQQAQEWLQGVAGASDEVKDLVLQDLWGKEGFQNA